MPCPCPMNDPNSVCLGPANQYVITFVDILDPGDPGFIPGSTVVQYEVCSCATPGISHIDIEICPENQVPAIDIDATFAANDGILEEEDGVEIIAPILTTPRRVRLNFQGTVFAEPGACEDVFLVYNGTFGDARLAPSFALVKAGNLPDFTTEALPALTVCTDEDVCLNNCEDVDCGETNVPFDCLIDVCPGFTLVPDSAQAAICSGDLDCEELSCEQEVEVTLCGQTFTCCVDIPLRRLFGTLTIATSAEFTDPCDNQVALCCQQVVPINVICPFCPNEAFDCNDLPALCELFAVSVGQPSQQNPGDDVIINGVVISRCNCAPSTETFTNDDGITIPAGGIANPYPSEIEVSGMTGAVSNVTVTLNGFTHTFPADVDVMLVAPDGTTNTILMSDPDGGTDVTNLTLTFDDAAANPVPCSGTLASGTYRPTNCFDFDPDAFPAPAPAPNPTVALSNFDGIDPNGTWSLYIVDDFFVDAGSISSWSITITTTCP